MRRALAVGSLFLAAAFGMLAGCGFAKNLERTSAGQLLMLLAQATNCWLTAGNGVSTSCTVTISGTLGVGGATPNANTKLAVNGRISSSVLGTYCGSSTANVTGNVGGYAGVKSVCETACGNTNAHLCTGHEIGVSRQLGVTIPAGHFFDGTVSSDVNGGNQVRDCNEWTDSGGAVYGFVTAAGVVACSTSTRLACCL